MAWYDHPGKADSVRLGYVVTQGQGFNEIVQALTICEISSKLDSRSGRGLFPPMGAENFLKQIHTSADNNGNG